MALTSILSDDNNRKTICRQYLNRMKKFFVLLNEAKQEQKGLSKKHLPEYSCYTVFGRIDFCPFRDKMLVVNYHNQVY
jgi:hypothetical protein